MHQVRGNVLQCSRFGCVVRLEDGRFGLLPASDPGIDVIKRALSAGRHPDLPFLVAYADGRHLRLSLIAVHDNVEADLQVRSVGSDWKIAPEAPKRLSSSLEQKIIDFWRQVSEWDRNAGRVDDDETSHVRTERLLPFEERAPRQYRETPKRSRKGLKSTRRNRQG